MHPKCVDHDHPELVVARAEFAHANVTLDHLAKRVLEGERFDTVGSVRCGWGTEVGLVDVHPAQVGHGLLNLWLAYYAAPRSPDSPRPDPWARQVLLPNEHHCYQHQESQPRLDTVADVLHIRGPNRAGRRAQRWRSRGGRHR